MPPWKIGIVGSGPRGLMVAERLGALLQTVDRRVEIYIIDEVEVGCGRIFRTDQPEWFLMNTTPGQISLFSGGPDGGPPRAGAGPSFAEWWSAVDPAGFSGPDAYAPRALYGRYLRFVLEAIEAGLPPQGRLRRIQGTVLDLEPAAGGYRLDLADGGHLNVDRVVLATGHAKPRRQGNEHGPDNFTAGDPGPIYVPGDSPADMPLDMIPAGAVVGVLGLGLSFYDVMSAVTVGRGGRFVKGIGRELVYRPSGGEPMLIGGSRSGLPLPAKGQNRKALGVVHKPVIFTAERIRCRAPGSRLDFKRDVFPWLMAEVNLAYFATVLHRSRGLFASQAFVRDVLRRAGDHPPDVGSVARLHSGVDLRPLDLSVLADRFAGRTFAQPAEFDRALIAVLSEGVSEDLSGATWTRH